MNIWLVLLFVLVLYTPILAVVTHVTNHRLPPDRDPEVQ